MEKLLLPMIPIDAMAVEDVLCVSPGIDQYMAASYDAFSRSQSVFLEEGNSSHTSGRGLTITKSSSMKTNAVIGSTSVPEKSKNTVTPAEDAFDGGDDDEAFGEFVAESPSKGDSKPPPNITTNNNRIDNNPMIAYLDKEELSPIAYNFLKALPDLSYVLIPP